MRLATPALGAASQPRLVRGATSQELTSRYPYGDGRGYTN